jgi:hypothetical protein
MTSQLDHKGKRAVQNRLTGRRAIARLLVAAAALVSVIGQAYAEEAVVLSSTAPGYTPGTAVADGQPLRLPERASLTLLFRSGEMLRLRGPLDRSLAQLRAGSRETSLQSLAAALRVSGVDAAVIGGTRTAARQRGEEDDVLVALERTATYCLAPTTPLWLTRATTGPLLVGLKRGGMLREVRFPETADRIEWPADVLIEDGDSIAFVAENGASRGAASFRKVAAATDFAWLAQLGLLGCTDQFQAARREMEARKLLPE